jgi:4-alpha-glucanotransferase
MGELRGRKTGVLMHISSLPGRYCAGDLGDAAGEFARMLSDAGVSVWQMLPLAPTSGAFFHSPYSSPSAFAGNIIYISPEKLVGMGLIDESEIDRRAVPASEKADYDRAYGIKKEILGICYRNFRKDGGFKDISDKFWDFCASEAYWLEDYALYMVLRELEGEVSWGDWRPEYKYRDWGVLDALKISPEILRALDELRFEQFLFFSQLEELREECGKLNVELMGDLPIYVAYDSADVWGHQDLFALDSDGWPSSVAGVPPDYFSATGLRWGNPTYRWDRMKNDGYRWWLGRFGHALKAADIVRIDHFRGFLKYWDIPAGERTAERGKWMPGPGNELFDAMKCRFTNPSTGMMPFIAEDLGVRTDDVIQAMDDFRFRGMKVLQFAFGEGMPDNPYIPHNHRRECVVYAGTHDNDTTVGWWESAPDTEKSNFERYMELRNPDGARVADAMIRSVLASTAALAVVTAQDIMRLGTQARMNKPSTTDGNWTWRLASFEPLAKEMGRIADLNALFGRSHPDNAEEERSLKLK